MIDDLFDNPDDGTILLRLHVQPGAGRTAVVGRHGDALKVRVAAPPEGGRANDACVELIATTLGVKPTAVEVVGGASSRSKRVRITGVEVDDLRRLLEEVAAAGAAPLGRKATGRESSGPRIR